MLSTEKNHLLCSVGAGTAMGELFRSVWIPAVPTEQLKTSGGSPVRLKLLGEELVAFRDGQGRAGVVQAQCAHRLAPLFFGRVEREGIRCAYHGWLYGADGECRDIPSEPGNAALCSRVRLKSYPTVEMAGAYWIYMGPGEPPSVPQLPWATAPASHRITDVWLQETSWLQGLEGDLDSSHVSVLHRSNSLDYLGTMMHRKYTYLDVSPKLFTQNTEIGLMSVARRNADDQYYWRVTQFLMPMFALTPGAVWPHTARAWVPIDDENTYTWNFSWSKEREIPKEYRARVESGELFPPQTEHRPYRLNTGAVIDTNVPIRGAGNNYFIDREQQAREGEVSGIHGINDQDRAMQEGMGHIVDRSRERLVAADFTVVAARRRLLETVGSIDSLAAFRRTVADGTAYSLDPLDAVHPAAELGDFLAFQTPATAI